MKLKLLIGLLTTMACFGCVSITRAQTRISGVVTDAHRLQPKISTGTSVLDTENGAFVVTDSGPFTITFSYLGYFELRISFDKKSPTVCDLGLVNMIEDKNWLHGPENGAIDERCPDGQLMFRRMVKKYKLHGLSVFYDPDGAVLQQIEFKNGRPVHISIRSGNGVKDLKFKFNCRQQSICVNSKDLR